MSCVHQLGKLPIDTPQKCEEFMQVIIHNEINQRVTSIREEIITAMEFDLEGYFARQHTFSTNGLVLEIFENSLVQNPWPPIWIQQPEFSLIATLHNPRFCDLDFIVIMNLRFTWELHLCTEGSIIIGRELSLDKGITSSISSGSLSVEAEAALVSTLCREINSLSGD